MRVTAQTIRWVWVFALLCACGHPGTELVVYQSIPQRLAMSEPLILDIVAADPSSESAASDLRKYIDDKLRQDGYRTGGGAHVLRVVVAVMPGGQHGEVSATVELWYRWDKQNRVLGHFVVLASAKDYGKRYFRSERDIGIERAALRIVAYLQKPAG